MIAVVITLVPCLCSLVSVTVQKGSVMDLTFFFRIILYCLQVSSEGDLNLCLQHLNGREVY